MATNPAWSKSYVYLGNRLLATLTPNPGTPNTELVQYHHPDRLGTRLVTDPSNGSSFEQVTLPFGTALESESSGQTNRRFSSYDRSTTTKLDYAVNRHYDPQQGRFTQVDPAGMNATSLTSPQTLNLYAYCTNDPINRIDPDGLGLISFFKKALRIFSKIVKILRIAALVALAIIILIPGGPLGAIAAWAWLHIFLPMAGLLGLKQTQLQTTHPWDPSHGGTWGGSGFQDQGPVFTCKNPPDCQNDIPPLPAEVVNVPIPLSIWSRVSRGIGNAVGSITAAMMMGAIKFHSYYSRYDAWVGRGIRGIDQRAAENSIIRGQTVTLRDGRTFKTPDMIIAIPAAGGLQTVEEAETIAFGHGARHLVGTGLSQAEVENAIRSQVRDIAQGASTGSFYGRVVVGGRLIEYRAFTLPNGTINVGTYYIPPGH